MRDHSTCIRGYFQVSKAWHAKTSLLPGVIDELTIGMYDPEGGTSGEFSIEWKFLSGKPTPQLKAFNDGWSALYHFKDMLEYMEQIDDQHVTPDEFVSKLRELGVKDLTPYEIT